MKHRYRTFVRWTVWIVFAMFLSLSGVLGFFTLKPGERMLSNFAERQLSGVLGQNVRIGRLETNLLSRLQIFDLHIYQADSTDTDGFIELEKGRIQYRLLPLITGKLIIESVDLTGADIHVVRDSSGIFKLPLPGTSTKKDSGSHPSPIQVEIQRVELEDGRFAFTDHSGQAPSLALTGLRTLMNLRQDAVYQFQAQVDSTRIEYREGRVDVADFLFIGEHRGIMVSIDTLSCHPPGMGLAGNGMVGFSQDNPLLKAKLHIEGNPSLILEELSPLLPALLSDLEGDIKMDLAVAGTTVDPSLEFRLTSPMLAVNDLDVESLLLEAAYAEDIIDIRELSGKAFKGSFGLSGSLALDSLYSFSLHSTLSKVDLASLWDYTYDNPSPYRGRLDGFLKAQGDLTHYRQATLEADISLRDVWYREQRIENFEATVNLAGGAAEFNLLGEGVQIEAELESTGQTFAGRFDANFEQLNPLAGMLNLPSLTGSLKVSGDIAGAMDSPDIDAQIEGRDIRYQEIPVDMLSGYVRIQNRQVLIDELAFSGGLDFTDSSDHPFQDLDLTGSIFYTGELRGDLENLRGAIAIKLDQPGYQTIQFDEGSGYIELNRQTIRVSPLEFRRDTLLFRFDTNFDLHTYAGEAGFMVFSTVPSPIDTLLSSTYAYEVEGLSELSLEGDIDVGNLAPLSTFIPVLSDIGGALHLQVVGKGIPNKAQGEATFTLWDIHSGGARLDSIQGTVILKSDQLAIPSVEFFLGNHKSWIGATVELTRDEQGKPTFSAGSAIVGEAHGHHFPLAAINPFLPEGFTLKGGSSYDLKWDGTFSEVLPHGEIQVDSGEVHWGADKPPFTGLFMNLAFQPGGFQVSRLDGLFGSIPFNINATVNTPDRRAFDLDIDLTVSDIGRLQTQGIVTPENLSIQLRSEHLNLMSFQPFFPSFPQIEGTLNTAIAVHGPPLDPQIDGFIDIQNLRMQPPPMNQALYGGIIKVRFDRHTVFADSLFMRLGQGWILSQGSLTHDDMKLQKIDLRTSLENIYYEQPKQLNLSVKSANLLYQGEGETYHLDGDVVLGKSKVLVDFQPQALLPFARKVERPVPELPGFITKTQLDVRIRDSQDIWVENNIARLRLHPEIEIFGSPTQLNLAGRLAIEEGYVLFLDRKFKMTRGIVDFIDPNRINPIVDIQAETNVRNYQAMELVSYDIFLKISGPIDQLVVELTSTPALERSDIVSLLTLGATREQLTGSSLERDDPSKTDILVDRAGELSSRKISGYLSKNLANATGLDDVSIEGNLFRFGKSWGPRLVASKRITDRMEVTYTTNVGHFNEKSVRVDYRLSKYFWLESQTDQQGKAGLDLKYKVKLK